MAVRGYVFTRQKDLLNPYDKALMEGLADIIALNDLESADPAQLQEVMRVRAEFDQLQKQWALPAIEKIRAGGDIDIAPILLDGQNRMASIRSQVLQLLRGG